MSARHCETQMQTITRRELEKALASSRPLVLLEALPPNYYEADRLPGALNLPLDEVDELAVALIPSFDSRVVTYCSGPCCQNSTTAAKRLRELGHTDVAVHEGGKEEWAAEGLAFEQGPADAVAQGQVRGRG
jgi:rhodanese-related sulfurtransferase